MPRFPIRKEPVSEDDGMLRGTISESDYTHITKVLRFGEGDRITVFDTEPTEYEGVITDISSKTIALRVHNTRQLQTEPELELNLFQAILKGNRYGWGNQSGNTARCIGNFSGNFRKNPGKVNRQGRQMEQNSLGIDKAVWKSDTACGFATG